MLTAIIIITIIIIITTIIIIDFFHELGPVLTAGKEDKSPGGEQAAGRCGGWGQAWGHRPKALEKVPPEHLSCRPHPLTCHSSPGIFKLVLEKVASVLQHFSGGPDRLGFESSVPHGL